MLQEVILSRSNRKLEIVIRQVSRETMRETLKDLDRRRINRLLVHLNAEDTYALLRSVSKLIRYLCTRTEGENGVRKLAAHLKRFLNELVS